MCWLGQVLKRINAHMCNPRDTRNQRQLRRIKMNIRNCSVPPQNSLPRPLKRTVCSALLGLSFIPAQVSAATERLPKKQCSRRERGSYIYIYIFFYPSMISVGSYLMAGPSLPPTPLPWRIMRRINLKSWNMQHDTGTVMEKRCLREKRVGLIMGAPAWCWTMLENMPAL